MPVPAAVTRALRWPFRRPSLARAWFGVEFGAIGPDDHYFDLVTPALVRRGAQLLPRGTTLVDLGCGPHAIVGLSLWRSLGARVTCVDTNPELVRRARESVARNAAPIEVRCSDLLDDLHDVEFDAVLFNPPYVPDAVGQQFGLPEPRGSQWRGGDDGAALVDAFCAALAVWPRPLTALLGVNRWFVKRERVAGAVDRHASLRRLEAWRAPLGPAEIHRIEHAPSQ